MVGMKQLDHSSCAVFEMNSSRRRRLKRGELSDQLVHVRCFIPEIRGVVVWLEEDAMLLVIVG